MKIRIAINGFGRIGRQVARLILAHQNRGMELAAINTIEDIQSCVFLLKHDSTRGICPSLIKTEGSSIIIDDNAAISFLNCLNPTDLPWKRENIDLVVECTGNGSLNNSPAAHLQAGARKVLITAASAFSEITLCHGVNNAVYNPEIHNLISSSSCTTNCIAPVAKVVNDVFGIEYGMATFLHSYTNNQPVLDTFCDDLRRSRSAAMNIIPTTTSAEHQLPLILPSLEGRFKAMAIRVPTPAVHLADFTMKLQKNASKDDLFHALEDAAAHEMKGIISIAQEPLVSIDYRKSFFSSTVDFAATQSYDDFVKILIWHDNEFSYSNRVVDLISFIGKK
jgi:glyceraldehyde 3-phosphate dehydrogenase